MGPADSEVRERLLNVAERMIAEEGCDAVTARRLAEALGLKRQIVHYYFRSIEDLIIAVIRRQGEALREHLAAALEQGESQATLWEPGSTTPAATFEFMAMATRREGVRAEVSRYMEEFRRMRADALAKRQVNKRVGHDAPPLAVATILTAVGQALALEEAIGVSLGHAETRAYVERWLGELRGV
jgi:AcrR family transcriptional regulator